jgi:hypothetical protein
VAFPAPLFNFARRWRAAGLALALVTLIAGARWAIIERFGSDLPAADQWDAEAVATLLPWFERDHFVAHLFTPHNEHRVVLTKLQALTEVLVVGQWDARVEAVANALLASLFVAAFWHNARRWTNAGGQIALAGAAALAFGLPLAWENILGGFHSQQWWLIGLSALALVHWPFAPTWSARWWFGAGAATLALGSMATGFVAAALAGVVAADRWRRRELPARDAVPTLLFAGAIGAAGLLLRVEFAPHAALRAGSAGEFLLHLGRSLQWPWRGAAWFGLLLWIPWLLVCARAGRRTTEVSTPAARTLAALGVWTLLQLAATSYARGAGADYPAPRYVDTLAFGLLVNATALAWLVRPAPSEPAPLNSRAHRFFAATWGVVFAGGLLLATSRVLSSELPPVRNFNRSAEEHLRVYLATNDPGELATEEIPFPSPEGLVWRLARPALRERLPVSVRPPLALAAGDPAGPAFSRNVASSRPLPSGRPEGLSPATPAYRAHPTWGSFGPGGPNERGIWISASLRANPGWLKFETAGHLGEPGVALELHDAQTGALVGSVRPSRVPGDSWRAAYVRAPRRPFVVVARDEDPRHWFAFSAPVEMSAGSYAAWQLARHGLLLAAIGVGVGLLPTLIVATSSRDERHQPAAAS